MNRENGAIYDPDADQGFVDAVQAGGLDVRKMDAHINDEVFAEYLMQVFMELTADQKTAAVS